MDLKVHPEQEKLMTVRTITGNIYYARSGTKVVGKVHEKFTLIDGIRVATGSYSFTWTDGKLNSSNLVILSGQVVEHFDLEFRSCTPSQSPSAPNSCPTSRSVASLTIWLTKSHSRRSPHWAICCVSGWPDSQVLPRRPAWTQRCRQRTETKPSATILRLPPSVMKTISAATRTS